MRQIWITRAGPPEVLRVKEAADPAPNTGEVRIRVEASGVNFADIMGRMGVYPDLPPIPVVPGYEVSGRIDAVASGIDQSWIGQDVIALTRFGGYADVICVPLKQIFPRPAGLSALEGAAIPVNYFTAWQLVVVMGALKANETVLIHSVGGGVGIAATQIAKHVGARVIGTASAGKHDEMRALGVDHLIDYRTEDFTDPRNHRWSRCRADPRRGRWRVLEKRIPRACPYWPARDVWRFFARERQGTQYFVHAFHACQHTMVSVQPASSHEREQRCIRRKCRPYVGRD